MGVSKWSGDGGFGVGMCTGRLVLEQGKFLRRGS